MRSVQDIAKALLTELNVQVPSMRFADQFDWDDTRMLADEVAEFGWESHPHVREALKVTVEHLNEARET